MQFQLLYLPEYWSKAHELSPWLQGIISDWSHYLLTVFGAAASYFGALDAVKALEPLNVGGPVVTAGFFAVFFSLLAACMFGLNNHGKDVSTVDFKNRDTTLLLRGVGSAFAFCALLALLFGMLMLAKQTGLVR
jgi:hypothetical protein